MPSQRLNNFFSPRNVALVGASERSMWSQGIVARFKEYEYEGQVYAVNRTGAPAHGYPGFTRCQDIGEQIDAAYIFVPAASVYEALVDVAAAGIKAVVILTSGFAEAGEDGKRLQDQICAYADAKGIALLGPNSLGFANIVQRRVLSVVPARLPIIDGGMGVVSQSGAALGDITRFAQQQGIGICFQAATGNEAQLSVADIIDYLVDMPECRVIAVFAESICHPQRLREAALRARAIKKPIVILKVGRSEVSAKVAQAHTGSLVGDDIVFDAVCKQLGIIRVNSIEELLITAALLEKTGPLSVPGVALVSLSGGACGMFADHAQACGLDLPTLSDATQAALRKVLPEYASTLNPLDITGGAIREPELWEKALPLVGADPSVGLVLVSSAVPAQPSEKHTQIAQGTSIARGLALSPVPGLLMSQTLQPFTVTTGEFLEETGVPGLSYSIEYTALAVSHLCRWSKQLAKGGAAPTPATCQASETPRSESEVLRFLHSQGVPVIPSVIASVRQDAVDYARTLNSRVAMKIASRDIAHKTEVGGVKLNVEGDDNVSAAYDSILNSARRNAPHAQIDGVLVAPMRDAGIELFIGTTLDPQWGPVIAVGLGGIWVELLKDTSVRLLPVNHEDALDMLISLRGAKLLQGFRGSQAADLERIADVIVKVGNAAVALGPDLQALEINPLLVNGADVEALDGLAIWRDQVPA
ncbi:acetate--CoA ligase family protein [Pseudomonas sp. NFX15]|uniref:acetate--CoA ligase family protein n=1 Tax=Pseudomonas sp. NFX15 TaxID=2816958 RepID=UPI003B8EA22A